MDRKVVEMIKMVENLRKMVEKGWNSKISLPSFRVGGSDLEKMERLVDKKMMKKVSEAIKEAKRSEDFVDKYFEVELGPKEYSGVSETEVHRLMEKYAENGWNVYQRNDESGCLGYIKTPNKDSRVWGE